MNYDFNSIDNDAIAGSGTPRDYAVEMPKATTLCMPSMVLTAEALGYSPQPGLIPQDFLKPMPSIVTTNPTVLESDCNPISKWAGANPLLAAAVLIGIGMLATRKGNA